MGTKSVLLCTCVSRCENVQWVSYLQIRQMKLLHYYQCQSRQKARECLFSSSRSFCKIGQILKTKVSSPKKQSHGYLREKVSSISKTQKTPQAAQRNYPSPELKQSLKTCRGAQASVRKKKDNFDIMIQSCTNKRNLGSCI